MPPAVRAGKHVIGGSPHGSSDARLRGTALLRVHALELADDHCFDRLHVVAARRVRELHLPPVVVALRVQPRGETHDALVVLMRVLQPTRVAQNLLMKPIFNGSHDGDARDGAQQSALVVQHEPDGARSIALRGLHELDHMPAEWAADLHLLEEVRVDEHVRELHEYGLWLPAAVQSQPGWPIRAGAGTSGCAMRIDLRGVSELGLGLGLVAGVNRRCSLNRGLSGRGCGHGPGH